jgi:solute carrier family 25 oxoglutarate transporter 11
VARGIIKNEGVPALWRGLSAGYLRQVVYGSARLGLFRAIADELRERRGGQPLPVPLKVLVGMTSGGLASVLGNPADLSLIRMQADNTLPLNQRRNYKGVGDALTRIVREEGVLGLWRGAGPTVVRAVCLNAAMMPVADWSKEKLSPHVGGEGSISASVVSAFLSGVAAAVASLPPDLVKTRLQKQVPDPVTGALPYAGSADCARKIAAKEGIGGFYVGLVTYIVRIAPHAFITLLVLDAINALWKGGKGGGKAGGTGAGVGAGVEAGTPLLPVLPPARALAGTGAGAGAELK